MRVRNIFICSDVVFWASSRMIKESFKVLPRMKVGARWLTAIPPDLAYGPAGDPPAIGPNETLLVEVELVEIKN